MANSPKDLQYTKQHEWVRLVGDEATAGITDFAQEQLGDIVYFDLPEPGARIKQHGKMGEVESVKTVSDLYAPLSGEVIEVNPKTADTPEVVNEDPYGGGWLLKIKPSDPSETDKLLSAEDYDALIAEAEGGQH
jgi:glycine cleavage system H protein